VGWAALGRKPLMGSRTCVAELAGLACRTVGLSDLLLDRAAIRYFYYYYFLVKGENEEKLKNNETFQTNNTNF